MFKTKQATNKHFEEETKIVWEILVKLTSHNLYNLYFLFPMTP